jgi:NADPH-dependent glutamate synthase beta subunit-like oxidoreductase/NAD-dependent dihydropyrimidine dehydrogenase PreA subunit
MKRPKDRLHRVIVVGATPAGIAATNKLGEIGIPVILVDSEGDLDEKLAADEYRLDSGLPFNYAHRPGLIRILRNASIERVFPAEVISLKHNPQGFRIRLKRRPTYIETDRCVLCGRCVDACPAIFSDGNKAIHFNSRMGLPGKPFIDKRQAPPCQADCPLGVNAQGYIALAKTGKFEEALDLIRQDNVLPGVCGRICTHPCETDCRRKEIDAPIAIRDIKRYVSETGERTAISDKDAVFKLKNRQTRSEKIAVIGSGPSGLAAAADLARCGYPVTIFEKEREPGGLLRYAVSPHRVPRDVLDNDIAHIKGLGVDFKMGHAVDADKELTDLSGEYKAVILATGTWEDRKLGVAGEELEGVEGCLSFLNRLYRNPISSFHEKTAVIGDGNAALDLARTLKRLGADVTLLSWFPLDLIPADPDEIKGAKEEKIPILDQLQVVEFSGDGGRLSRLIAVPTKPGKPDENGIPWPVKTADGQPVELEFSKAFVAIGQSGPFKTKNHGRITTTQQGFIQTNGSCRTNLKGVYAAGDAVSGPSSVVHAMAAGRMAAIEVHKDLGGKETRDDSPERPALKDFPQIPQDLPALARPCMPELQPSARMTGFAEIALGLNESQVLFESGRCLQCGVCSQCLQCVDACGDIGAVKHHDRDEEITEHAGVVIVADPQITPDIKGEDVIRAYGPKSAKTDVNAMVARGFAAAANAMALLGRTSQRPKGQGISFHAPDPGLSPVIRVGIFACRCNDALGWSEDMTRYLENLVDQEHIVHAEVLLSACISEGCSSMLRTIREKGITRLVLASCVCCPLNFVCSACSDQRTRLKHGLFSGTGISRSMVETCNIRGEVLRMLKKNPEHAFKRFAGLINRSVSRAKKLKPLPAPARNYNFATAVIGGSEAALNSAAILAESGLEVILFNAGKDLQKNLFHPNIHCFENSEVQSISGTLGNFRLSVQTPEFQRSMQFGAVILGEKSRSNIPYIYQPDLPSRTVESAMQKSGKAGIPFLAPGATSISGLYLADPPGIQISKRKKGASAAVSAAATMPRGPRQSKGFTVTVNEALCRGCGRCLAICPYQAVTLRQNDIGGWIAVVDEAICKGCGNCISNCPSNAADSPYRDQAFLEQTIEEILSSPGPGISGTDHRRDTFVIRRVDG